MDHVTIDAFLCDSVANADGKLYVQGAGWNLIGARRFPVRHPRVGVGVILTIGDGYPGAEIEVELRLENSAGDLLFLGERPVGSGVGAVSGAGRMHLSTPVERPDLLGDGDDHVVAIAFNVDGVTFAGADNYRFVLAVNGRDRQTLRFRVADYRG